MNAAIFVKVLISIYFVLVVESEASVENFELLVDQTIQKCKLKENVSDGDIPAAPTFIDGDWPETREGKCFIDCCFQEVGIVR